MLLEEVENLGKDYVYCLISNPTPDIILARVFDIYYLGYHNLNKFTRKLISWVDHVGGNKNLKFYKSNIMKIVNLTYFKSKYYKCRSGFDYYYNFPVVSIISYKHRRIYKKNPVQLISRNKEDVRKLYDMFLHIGHYDNPHFINWVEHGRSRALFI